MERQPYKKDRGACHSFKGLKTGLVPLRMLSLKRSTAEAFCGNSRVMSQKTMTRANVFCKNWYLSGKKKVPSHAHKTGSYFFFKKQVLSKSVIFENYTCQNRNFRNIFSYKPNLMSRIGKI